MLCFVMSCHVMSCYVMLCYVMSCYVMLCHVILGYIKLFYVTLCYIMLHYVILCYIMLCYIILYYIIFIILYYIILYYIILLGITFTQRVYNYISETNIVSRIKLLAAIQQLQFKVHVVLRSAVCCNITQLVVVMLFTVLNVLYIYISTLRSICAVSDMAAFCSLSTLCFPATALRYYLNDSEMVPVAPVVTGITSVFASHMRYISIVIYLYMRIFSVSFFILLP